MIAMNNTKKFFIDMDGVLARWTTGSSIEEVKSPGFFLNLEAEVTLIEVVLELVRQGYSVSILSHVFGPRAASEKSSWLEDNGLGFVHKTFVPIERPKAEYIEENDDCVNILIDDYTKNLKEWESSHPNNVGVKLYNGVNGTNGTWEGKFISLDQSFDEIIKTLTTEIK